MKFSVDKESISDITASLNAYSDDINSVFGGFREEVKAIALKTNYNKLLLALQGIDDIYNDVICGELRKKLISRWTDERESLTSFAEAVYMGEESENAVMQIEAGLEDIFTAKAADPLTGLRFEEDANATKDDFDEAVSCFENLEKELARIKEENINHFTDKSCDNELYKFLLPLVESIAVGAESFVGAAKKEMSRLGDNYVEKMESTRQKTEDAKNAKKTVDFDLDLFDFGDGAPSGTSVTSAATKSAAPVERSTAPAVSAAPVKETQGKKEGYENNEERSKEHIRNVCEKLMQDFAPDRTDRASVEDIIEYENADNLEKYLREFDCSECTMCQREEEILKLGELRSKPYVKELKYLDEEYAEKHGRKYEEYKKKCEDKWNKLRWNFLMRIISKIVGIDRAGRIAEEMNYAYLQEVGKLEAEYQQKQVGRIESLKKYRNKWCSELSENHITWANELQTKSEETLEKVGKCFKLIELCLPPCGKLIKVKQAYCFAQKPAVLGFSSNYLGHRITINDKKKTWIDANLSENEQKKASYDGVLNMKTPIHEYLHYLTNGEYGTSGVKNMDEINNIRDEGRRNMINSAMTGFNEGITEMFAQDYLEDEMETSYNFRSENAVLSKDKKILKQKSYTEQVDVVRKICEIIGKDKVKEAYIKHDLSIIKNSIAKAVGRTDSGEWKDMEDIIYGMDVIQSNYGSASLTKEEKKGLTEQEQKDLLNKKKEERKKNLRNSSNNIEKILERLKKEKEQKDAEELIWMSEQ